MPAVFAQSEPGFEVASIKPAPDLTELVRSHSTHVGVKIDRALADFGALSLDDLIQYAFGIKPFQLPGGGDASAHFDIMAKLPYGATPEEVPAMMQQPTDFDRAAAVERRTGPLTLDRLAEALTPYFDRPVVNQTAMEGKFMVPLGRLGQAWPNRWSDPAHCETAASQTCRCRIMPAWLRFLAELGLKLESRKVDFPVLVIDKLEKKPTEQEL